jgi:hypothetical protein
MANVREVHFASRDPWAGGIGLLDATPAFMSGPSTL